MGTTTRIEALSSREFVPKLATYVATRDQSDTKQLGYWALVKQIRIRCPAPCLSSGIVLVDLPGVADVNAARCNITSDYIQKADHFWITAPITRAVSDQVAHSGCL